MIYTSYFANKKNMPDSFIHLAISYTTPSVSGGLMPAIPSLAPNIATVSQLKSGQISESLFAYYYVQKLKVLPQDIIDFLYQAAISDDVYVLYCYESPEKFCHRHILREFLSNKGIKSEEYKRYPDIKVFNAKELLNKSNINFNYE